MTPAEMLAEFHEALGQPYGHGFDAELRARLQHEETRELIDALRTFDEACEPFTDADATTKRYAELAQELADVVYVAYGTAHVLGIPLDRVLAEVHRANMSKFDENGRPLLRDDGKLLKSDSYTPPDIEHVLAEPEGGSTVNPDGAKPTLIDRDGSAWVWIAGAYYSLGAPTQRAAIEAAWGPVTEKVDPKSDLS
jgi:predicted HAD superfamily Cof-like phosphohydrolase